MNLIISIDVEEDLWDRYQRTDNPVVNIDYLPKLQAIFDRYNAIPTYLVNWPVVTTDRSRRILVKLLEQGKCAIGMHIHPWNTPPFQENVSARNSLICNLPTELIQEKLYNLNAAIEDRLGISPTCFRAGRWGFGTNVAHALSKLNYSIDSSITPFIDWTETEGPDFSNAPMRAYPFYPNNILIPAEGGPIFEIPPTIGFFQKPFCLCIKIRKFLSRGASARLPILGLLDRLGLLNLRWLSPELNTLEGMIRLSRTFQKTDAGYLHMVFHSTALLPGACPFVKNKEEQKHFFNRLDQYLQFASMQGFNFKGLPEII